VFGMGGVDLVGCSGWPIIIGVGVRVGLLEKVFSNKVWEVWITNSLPKAVEAVRVFPGYSGS